MNFRVWAETDSGAVRKHNEDALVSRPDMGFWAVADGAGGHASGEVASGMLAETLGAIPQDLPPADLLACVRTQVSAVHEALRREAQRRDRESGSEGGMIASTLVTLVIRGEHFACLWAGDSRAYLLRSGVLQQVTRDHSLVQELVDSGLIRQDQAESHPQANVITRAIGSEDEAVELDKVSGQTAPGDRFLLCSDGLCKTLDEDALARLLGSDSELGPAVDLIAAALEQQARDNITAVVVEIGVVR